MSQHPASPARVAASRRNAQKSTGPRTAAGKVRSRLNALRHGGYGQARPSILQEFGEESEEYQELLAAELESCPPANSLERELIEDVARLRWERRRLARAKEGKVRARLEAQELAWQRRLVEMEFDYNTAPPEQAMAFGLRRVKDSAGKFRDLLSLLDVLEKQIGEGDFSPETSRLFEGLWGVKPTLRGVEIIGGFNQLAQQGGLKYIRPDRIPPANGTVGSAAEAAAALPAPSPLTPEEARAKQEEIMVYRSLRLALEEEKRDVLVEYNLFRKQRVPASRAAIDACLAPTDDGEWRLLIRWENTIDQQIERKIKLYLLLHRQMRAGGPSRGKRRGASRSARTPAPGGGGKRGGGHSQVGGGRLRLQNGAGGHRPPLQQRERGARRESYSSARGWRHARWPISSGVVGCRPPLQYEAGGHRPPLQRWASRSSGCAVNCRLSTVNYPVFFRNEAEKLLKTKRGFWNEAKRSQETAGGRLRDRAWLRVASRESRVESSELNSGSRSFEGVESGPSAARALNPQPSTFLTQLLTVNCRL